MTDVPERYADYAGGRSEPRFTGWLRDRAEPAWTDAIAHPFTRDVGAGTLDPDTFADYPVQAYAFVDALVSTFGYAVGQAPDMAAKRPLVEFLETVTDDEDDYFRRSFAALEVPTDRKSVV